MYELSYMSGFLAHWSYLGMAVLFGVGGYAVPIPEEIVLMTAGYLASVHIMNPYITIPIAIGSIFIADLILFFTARHGSVWAKNVYCAIRGRSALNRYGLTSRAHPYRTIFLTRFIPGLRFISPLTAAFSSIPWYLYAAINLVALTIHTVFWICFGLFFSESITAIGAKIIAAEEVLFSVFIIVVMVAILAFVVKIFMSDIQEE